MSFTLTTNYGLKKVDVGTELNVWGPIPNENWDKVSTQMKLNADAAAAAMTAVNNIAATGIPDGGVTTVKLANAAVTNAKLANMAASTMKGAVVAGAPIDLSVAQVKSILGITTGTGGSGTTIPELEKSGNYTLAAVDAGKMITLMGGSTKTITVNTGVFPVDSWVQLIKIGDGTVIFGGTASLLSSKGNDACLSGPYAHATIWFRTAGEYVLYGDIADLTP